MAKKARHDGQSQRVIRVAIGIVWRDTQILICQRLPDAKLSGFWEFPGGKCEIAETDPACAIREVKEEVGIDVKAIGQLSCITHTYDYATVTLVPIVCEYLSGDARPIGCAQVRWVAPDALLTYRFPPANASLLAELIANGSAPLTPTDPSPCAIPAAHSPDRED